MPLWGKDTDAESRPKFLPIDSNAQGSSGARQDAIALKFCVLLGSACDLLCVALPVPC